MRIGLEAERANLKNPTGVERYSLELIKHLAQIDKDNEYELYFRTKPQDWFLGLPTNFKLRLIPFPKFWTQIRLSYEMLTRPVDVLAILASAMPIYHPKNSVVTVHDIAFEFFPEAFTPFMRKYLIWSTRFAVNKAKKIIAISQSTKNDLLRVYGVPEDKIEIIPLGVNPTLRPLPQNEIEPILKKFGLEHKNYVLFVGTLQPRKNIPRLIDAFALLKKKGRIEDKLAIVGGKGWIWKPITDKIRSAGLGNEVRFLDYVDNDDLHKLYCGAKLLTLPALYEGFGLPPLEAMACGTPTVVSNVSSLPEVVGDAGVLVDPNSIESIAEGITRLVTDDRLRMELGAKSLVQAKKFSWEQTAQKTKYLYEALKS